MKISYNKILGRHQAISELTGTGRFWTFDNGQFGEQKEHMEGKEIYLAYHYDRVYVNTCNYNDMGWRGNSSQFPLTSPYCNAATRGIAQTIFEADKKAGYIAEDYIFQ